MFNSIDLDALHSLTNIGTIALGALAIIFVLRGVFKVAWKVIKLLLILLGMLVIVGYFAGWLKISII
jgi:hypothetical protein